MRASELPMGRLFGGGEAGKLLDREGKAERKEMGGMNGREVGYCPM